MKTKIFVALQVFVATVGILLVSANALEPVAQSDQIAAGNLIVGKEVVVEQFADTQTSSNTPPETRMLTITGTEGDQIHSTTVQPEINSPTIYIRADGSIEPATTPIQREGDRYTLTADIIGNSGIVIERNNIVLDGANHLVEGTEITFPPIGVLLEGRENVTITNMTLRLFSWCIFLSSSSSIFVLANNITSDNRYGNGIRLDSSSNNIISRNNITDNYYYGVSLFSSNCNTFSENNIATNNYDVELRSSSNNIFFHNNFLRSDPQLSLDSSSISNVWESGFPSGGNYWSDYGGTDANHDKIGDAPYIIDANNQDDFPLMSPWTEADGGMRLGVNYLSTHYHYEPYYLSDEELDRDFGFFRDQGLVYVTLCAVWKYLEPELGNYNENAIDDLVRVCNFASEYNLKVIIDFHTMMSNNSWTMPTWLSPRKFETVFTNETARLAWLNFLNHCAERLNSSESIWSWNMMNEPARGEWACDVSIDDFLQLWDEMTNVFKTYSDRPISVRFAAQVFEDPNHFNCDSRIYNAFDYVALNWYEDYCSAESLANIVSEAQEHGGNIVMTEFGSNATEDADQASDYQRHFGLFRSLGLTDCIAWMWRADYNLGAPDLPGVGYNLAKDVDGTPRSAFLLLDSVLPIISLACPSEGECLDKVETVWIDGTVTEYNKAGNTPAINDTRFTLEDWEPETGLFAFANSTTIPEGLVNVEVSFTDFAGNRASEAIRFTVAGAANPYLVVRGGNSRIYYRLYNATMDAWDGWVVLPGSTIDSPAATVCNNELHVVVRGSTGYTLWHGYVDLATSTFSGWTLLSGSSPSAPTLTANSTHLCMVVRGNNNLIYHRFYDCALDTWTGWTALPLGTTADSPAAAMLGNKLHVVVRGTVGNSIWHCTVDLSTQAFSGWQPVGGTTPSRPMLAASETRDEVYLVVRGSTNFIFRNTWSETGWAGWTALPTGSTPDGPAATVIGDNLHMVVKGAGGTTLWHSTLNLDTSAFSSWTLLYGSTPSAPTLTS